MESWACEGDLVRVRPEHRGVGVSLGEEVGQHFRPVGSLPPELGLDVLDVLPEASHEVEGVYPEAPEYLGELAHVAEGVGYVALLHHGPELAGDPVAEEQISNQGFPGDQELVRLDVPRPDVQPRFVHEPP